MLSGESGAQAVIYTSQSPPVPCFATVNGVRRGRIAFLVVASAIGVVGVIYLLLAGLTDRHDACRCGDGKLVEGMALAHWETREESCTSLCSAHGGGVWIGDWLQPAADGGRELQTDLAAVGAEAALADSDLPACDKRRGPVVTTTSADRRVSEMMFFDGGVVLVPCRETFDEAGDFPPGTP